MSHRRLVKRGVMQLVVIGCVCGHSDLSGTTLLVLEAPPCTIVFLYSLQMMCIGRAREVKTNWPTLKSPPGTISLPSSTTCLALCFSPAHTCACPL